MKETTTVISPKPPKTFSLPDELLAAVATAGQEDCDDALGLGWTLSHVSRRFRNTVIGTPSLWTRVEITLGSEDSVEIFKLHLERSKVCKLWVTLRDISVMADTVTEHLSHLVPHISRIWRSDMALDDTKSILAVLVPFRHAAAPCLEHLDIKMINTHGSFSMNIFSAGAPRLTSLKLNKCVPCFPVPQWTTSLTHLEWRCGDAYQDGNRFFPAVMAQCPLLVHLSLDTRHMTELERMSIPSLKSLVVFIGQSLSCSYVEEICGFFDTPALTDLTINFAHGPHICHLFNSTSLPSSFPVLTFLTFVGSCSAWDEFRYLPPLPPPQKILSPPLHLFPALSSLSLVGQCSTANIISDLLGPNSPPWPFLRTITVCPKDSDVEEIYTALQLVVRSKKPLPGFRFSTLLYEYSWDEHGVDAELYDPADLIDALELIYPFDMSP
ncbi:hypothetical protein DFH07DRAFT_468057 [Mycena maculata]|uniref:F-box domain-containing protein n=1 Tax=Mycena maculata TaxID=230809 RepID=A0AAD7K8B9_9AGAR|nr:hypothetical protein DFH07DRAFT_468057 [Mycena maculata]